MYSEFRFMVLNTFLVLGRKQERERDCDSTVPASLDISCTSYVSSLVDLDNQEFDEDNPPHLRNEKVQQLGSAYAF